MWSSTVCQSARDTPAGHSKALLENNSQYLVDEVGDIKPRVGATCVAQAMTRRVLAAVLAFRMMRKNIKLRAGS